MVGQKLVGLLNTRIKAFIPVEGEFSRFFNYSKNAMFAMFAVFAVLYRVLRKRFILSLAHFYVSSQYISKEGV